MSLSKQQISIRYGLLLQECVAEALKATAFNTYVPTKKYDDDQMTPDFLIPDDSNPTHVVEVTQTNIRSNFQRKILRYFVAVTESKIHFGPKVISVNILFGNSNDLPRSNVDALYSFFDSNLCPYDRADNSEKLVIASLENCARSLAGDEAHESVSSALKVLVDSNKVAISILAKQLDELLSGGVAKSHLFPLWKLEKKRKDISEIPTGTLVETIAYKKPLLQTLFLTDSDYETVSKKQSFEKLDVSLQRELLMKSLVQLTRSDQKALSSISLVSPKMLNEIRKNANPKMYSKELLGALETAGIIYKSSSNEFSVKKNVDEWEMSAEITRFIKSPGTLTLDREFGAVVTDPLSIELRKECLDAINESSSLIDFFEDIRSEDRRLEMCEKFLKIVMSPDRVIEDRLLENLSSDVFLGIRHGRCWLADLLPLYIGCSHNEFNSDMFSSADYTESLANPFNNITTKAPRVIRSESPRKSYIQPAVRSFRRLSKLNTPLAGQLALRTLSERLLKLRMHGAISMQKFNPIHIFIRAVAKKIGAEIRYEATNNVLSDLVQDVDAVGKFDVFNIEFEGVTILANGLYVDEYGGLDKAKEWSARGRAFPYRYKDGKITKSVKAMVFVADGPWKTESIKRLREGGWIVCRPAEFLEVLKANLQDG